MWIFKSNKLLIKYDVKLDFVSLPLVWIYKNLESDQFGGSANGKASDSPPKHRLIWGRFLPSVHITSPQWKAFCGVMVHPLPLMVRWQEILFHMFESRKVSLLNQVTPIFGSWDLSSYFFIMVHQQSTRGFIVLIWTTDFNRLQLRTDYIFSNV